MRTTVAEKQRTLIDNLVAARHSVVEAARAFPPDRYERPFLGTWSIMDLLAHLIGWDHTNIQAIEEISAGQYPSFFQFYDKDWQSYNQRLVQEHRLASFEAQIEAVEASHRQLIAYLEALPAATVVRGGARRANGRRVTSANLLRAEAADEQEHAAQVRAYLQTIATAV